VRRGPKPNKIHAIAPPTMAVIEAPSRHYDQCSSDGPVDRPLERPFENLSSNGAHDRGKGVAQESLADNRHVEQRTL
jgi:hypothetical protein